MARRRTWTPHDLQNLLSSPPVTLTAVLWDARDEVDPADAAARFVDEVGHWFRGIGSSAGTLRARATHAPFGSGSRRAVVLSHRG
jgi:hypothetical protein